MIHRTFKNAPLLVLFLNLKINVQYHFKYYSERELNAFRKRLFNIILSKLSV